MSILGSLINFGGSSNPYDAAMGYSEELPGTITPYYQPYIDTGLRSMSTLEQQFNALLNNPAAMQQMLGQGFQQSPGYQFQYDQAMNASNNASAAGGMLGSPSHQQQSSQMATNLANQDYYNYYDNNADLYGMGLQGHGQLNQMGYGASNQLAQMLAQNLMNQAAMAAGSAQHENSMLSDLTGGLF